MKYIVYSGAGNTFAIVEKPISGQEASRLCEKCRADGVIFPSSPFQMRILNRDGSEAEMCGNGLRCYVKYLIEQKNILKDNYAIETLGGTYFAWPSQNQISVRCPPPRDLRWNLSVEGFTLHHLNTGVPHAVIFVDSIEKIDLMGLAPKIRHHPLFPQGANVNFLSLNPLQIRTYERGVEGETLACGTGVTASALAAAKCYHLPSPLAIQVRSGDILKVAFSPDWEEITVEGPAVYKSEGFFS